MTFKHTLETFLTT